MRHVVALVAAILVVQPAFADPSLKLLQGAKSGDLKRCKNALKKKANVDFVGVDGATPLWHAARNGHVDIVDLLIEKKANSLFAPTATDDAIQTPSFASSVLVSPRGWRNRGQSRNTKTVYAVESPRKGIFKRNVEVSHLDMARIYENQKELNRKRGLPIHVAILQGHADVVRMLLKKGRVKQITAQDENNNNPVHLVSSEDDLDLFDAVVTPTEVKNRKRFKANLLGAVNSYNREGFVPLHIAVRAGGMSMVGKIQALLNAGAFPNANSLNDQTSLRPLELACDGRRTSLKEGDADESHRYSHAIILLLLAGAEAQGKSCIEQTKLFSALQNRFKSYVFEQLATKSRDKSRRDPLEALYDQLISRKANENDDDTAEQSVSSSHYDVSDFMHESDS